MKLSYFWPRVNFWHFIRTTKSCFKRKTNLLKIAQGVWQYFVHFRWVYRISEYWHLFYAVSLLNKRSFSMFGLKWKPQFSFIILRKEYYEMLFQTYLYKLIKFNVFYVNKIIILLTCFPNVWPHLIGFSPE